MHRGARVSAPVIGNDSMPMVPVHMTVRTTVLTLLSTHTQLNFHHHQLHFIQHGAFLNRFRTLRGKLSYFLSAQRRVEGELKNYSKEEKCKQAKAIIFFQCIQTLSLKALLSSCEK